MTKLRQEIVLVAGTVVAAINAVQVAALPLPTWAHTTIAIVSIVGGAVLTRMGTTPTTSSASSSGNSGV